MVRHSFGDLSGQSERKGYDVDAKLKNLAGSGSCVLPTVLKLGLKTLFHLGIAGSVGCLSDELARACGILCLQPLR